MLEEKNNNYDYMDERLPDDGGRTLEDIISAVGEQDLAEIPHVPMTPERLAALAAARDAEESLAASEANRDVAENFAAPEPNRGAAAENPATLIGTAKMRKKKRPYKLVGGIAAVFVLILIGAVVAFNALSVDVGADKNRKEEIVTEDGVVIEDGGYGASDGTNDNTWSTTDWDFVASAKTLYPELMVPEYIPEGYEFEQLMIEQVETGGFSCCYTFCNQNQVILEIEKFVQEDTLMSIDMNDVSRTIESNKGSIHIQEYDNKIATIQIDSGTTIIIWSNISDKEIIKIVENINN